MPMNDKGKQRADPDEYDYEHEDPSSPRSFAHLAALSSRLHDFRVKPNERDLAYLQATVGPAAITFTS